MHAKGLKQCFPEGRQAYSLCPGARLPVGLDKLAAQKRAEQAKQGSLLGEGLARLRPSWTPVLYFPLFRSVDKLNKNWRRAAAQADDYGVYGSPRRCCPLCSAGKRPLLSLGSEEQEQEEGGGDDLPAGRDSDSGAAGAAGSREKRHYRGQRMETPSHPGGVSQSARDAIAEREQRRQREREREGVYADTRHRGDRDRGRDGERDWRDRGRCVGKGGRALG